jgi:hypothetical protein
MLGGKFMNKHGTEFEAARRSANRNVCLKAPFPWFGGKRCVASLVWAGLGNVDNYVEPFAGSLAVLLGRPTAPRLETVNDADAYLCNFWRALAADPEEVVRWADWPVNETDLFARHLWLVNEGKRRVEQMEADPDFFDVKVAGWWVWGINSWIGGGWCSGNAPWRVVDGKVVLTQHLDDAGQGVNRKRPHLGNAGQGVNRQRPDLGPGRGINRQLPHLGNAGQGVNRQLFHLGNAGQGVKRKLPHLGSAGQGVNRQLQYDAILDYFRALAARLRRVRVCCGDWSRVVTNGALAYGRTVGVFLDPPYLGDVRCRDLYRVDDHTVSIEVRNWALAHGDDPRLRIVLAGYWQEHAAAMPPTWRAHRYSARRSYGTRASVGSGKGNDANRHNECLWFSSACKQTERLPLLEAR